MIKRGRPRKKSAKNIRIELRISPEDNTKLKIIAHDTGLSTSEILRRALGIMYDMYFSR